MSRPFVFIMFSLAACASSPRPVQSTSSCGVVTERSQLDGCVGKTVTVRGKVSNPQHPQIAGVTVDATPELIDEPAHAVGTLQQDESGYVLRDGESLAKAHGTRPKPL